MDIINVDEMNKVKKKLSNGFILNQYKNRKKPNFTGNIQLLL